jgi:hypothetical protein
MCRIDSPVTASSNFWDWVADYQAGVDLRPQTARLPQVSNCRARPNGTSCTHTLLLWNWKAENEVPILNSALHLRRRGGAFACLVPGIGTAAFANPPSSDFILAADLGSVRWMWKCLIPSHCREPFGST